MTKYLMMDRFAGCLLGQAAGDALGMVVEGAANGTAREYAGRLLAGELPRNIGQYTDDTQLARDLLISLTECRGFDPEDYSRRIARLFETGAVVGSGAATRQAAERLIQGVPWAAAGTPPPAAGNGSAMRAAPVGLFYAANSTLLHRFAGRQSMITHRDPRCTAGSIVVAGAVAMALYSRRLDPDTWLHRLHDWVEPVSPVMAEGLTRIPDWIGMDPESAARAVSRFDSGDIPAGDGPEITPYVVPGVLWSLTAFFKHPDSFTDAVACAVFPGGDTDTTAAMTGAISGTFLGLDAIPLPILRRITDRGAWESRELIRLAYRGWEISSAVTAGCAPDTACSRGFTLPLADLQPSQLWIDEEKLRAVEDQPVQGLIRQNPLPVKRLDEKLVLTDGHTRALAAARAGMDRVNAVWETGSLDWDAYFICMDWCRAEGIQTIHDLAERILPADEYRIRWLDRCAEMQSDLEQRRRSRWNETAVG